MKRNNKRVIISMVCGLVMHNVYAPPVFEARRPTEVQKKKPETKQERLERELSEKEKRRNELQKEFDQLQNAVAKVKPGDEITAETQVLQEALRRKSFEVQQAKLEFQQAYEKKQKAETGTVEHYTQKLKGLFEPALPPEHDIGAVSPQPKPEGLAPERVRPMTAKEYAQVKPLTAQELGDGIRIALKTNEPIILKSLTERLERSFEREAFGKEIAKKKNLESQLEFLDKKLQELFSMKEIMQDAQKKASKASQEMKGELGKLADKIYEHDNLVKSTIISVFNEGKIVSRWGRILERFIQFFSRARIAESSSSSRVKEIAQIRKELRLKDALLLEETSKGIDKRVKDLEVKSKSESLTEEERSELIKYKTQLETLKQQFEGIKKNLDGAIEKFDELMSNVNNRLRHRTRGKDNSLFMKLMLGYKEELEQAGSEAMKESQVC